MQIVKTEIADIKLLKPLRHVDSRGFFSEVFKGNVFQQHGIEVHFVQDNHSLSASRGVVRGLHFQVPPFAQAKLLRVTAGSIFDVAVDIRWGSPSFGPHVAAILSASERSQISYRKGSLTAIARSSRIRRSFLQGKRVLYARARLRPIPLSASPGRYLPTKR